MINSPLEISADYDRCCSKGTDVSVWYVVYGTDVMIIRHGKTRWAYCLPETIDNHFGNKHNYHLRDKSIPESKHEFDSFFDTSTGKEIWKSEQIKDQERSGQVFCTPREAKEEAAKNKKHLIEKDSRRHSKEFREAMVPVLKRAGVFR